MFNIMYFVLVIKQGGFKKINFILRRNLKHVQKAFRNLIKIFN